MFIKQAFDYLHESWRYVLGVVVIFSIWQLGSLPFVGAIMAKVMMDGGDLSVLEDPNALMMVLESNLTLFLMLLSFAIGLLGIWFWVKYVHRQPMLKLTTIRKKMDWGRFAFGFSMVAVFTIVTTLIDYKISSEDYEIQFQLIPFLILAVIAIVMIPLQTSFEEYLFRGYLMQGIGVSSHKKKFAFLFIATTVFLIAFYFIYSEMDLGIEMYSLIFLGGLGLIALLTFTSILNGFFESSVYASLRGLLTSKFTPLVITSVIFGGMHIANPEVEKLGPIIMVYYIGTGFLLGIMTLMDEGMELALGFHAGNNLVAALLVTADWTAFQTNSILKDISEPEVGFSILGPVFIIYPIFLGLMAWRYKWTGWKEKLFGKVEAPLTKEKDPFQVNEATNF